MEINPERIEGFVRTVHGRNNGKHVLIFAGIHGNETCGLNAFEELIPKLVLDAGSATFIIGNPRAVAAGVRFTQANLNRMFKDDALISETLKDTYEYRRSRELMPLMSSVDGILDIHSSASPESTPFTICCPQSRGFARSLGFPIVSWGWENIEPGGTDDYAESQGVTALGIECGFHEEPAAIGRARNAILDFLALNELLIERKVSVSPNQRMIEAFGVHKPVTNFVPVRAFADFEPIRKGDLIGIDGVTEHYAPEDCLVVFVRHRAVPGQEAYILAREWKN